MRGKNMSLNWTENKRRIQRGMLAFLVLLACFLCVKPTQAAGTRIRGIDVSRYQGTINWKKVKNAGIDFTMIGVGYVIDGVRQGDPKFEYNIKNAIQAGVDVGVYIYSHATTVAEAREEADFVLNQIDGYKISYPVAFDIEDTVHLKLTTKQRTDITIAFLEEIEEAGYYPMIYASEYWFNSNMDLSRLTKYDKWVARWGSTVAFKPLSMWQYSSTGRVNGISTAVDLDYSYKDYSRLITPRTTPKERKKKTGWQTDGKRYWYVNEDGSYVKNTFKTIGGKRYYFDSNGYRVSGWKKIKGKYYYFVKKTGVMKTGWLTLSGKTYYLSPSTGARRTGWITVSGKKYYLNKSGVRQTGWKTSGKKTYYLGNKTGAALSGWQKIGGKYYYFDKNGVRRTGWVKVSGKKYYLNSKGVRQYGWLTRGGKKYFLNLKSGSIRTGWMTYKGKTYYFSKQTGQMRRGWLTFGEKRYYMKKDGSRAKGWQRIGGKWYYFLKKTGVMKKDGKIGRYIFDENGVCTNR